MGERLTSNVRRLRQGFRMRLTLRDLFWLALLVAAMAAWVVEQRRSAEFRRYRALSHFSKILGVKRVGDQELRRYAAAAEFAEMSDEELSDYFASFPPSKVYQVVDRHFFERCSDYETCLVEMARRGLVGQLQQQYDTLMANSATKSGSDFPDNLELLTALRRAEGNRDPLTIRLELDGSPRVMSKFAEPRLRAVIENVDIGREPVKLLEGGDYRGGRLERWRFLLKDKYGKRVADSADLWFGNGGILQSYPLIYGAKSSWDYKFDLRSYLAPPASGTYYLQAFFHGRYIARDRDISGLIAVKSEPISVVVENRDPSNSRRYLGRFPGPLGVLAVCFVLAVSSIVRPRKAGISAPGQHVSETRSLPGILRRDFCWGILILVFAIAMWLTDGRHESDAGWYQRPDTEAQWAIRLADDAK